MKFAFAFAVSLLIGTGMASAEMRAPSGPVVLPVSGAITQTNASGVAKFDLDMLEALASRKTTTKTPWTEGTPTFEGPLGSALLEAVGASGQVLVVTALNDYSAEIPVEDFKKWPVILATKRDGERMPIRDKGPLFVIYPFDVDESLYSEIYFNRSVWQVKSIEVR